MDRLRKIIALIVLVLTLSTCGSSSPSTAGPANRLVADHGNNANTESSVDRSASEPGPETIQSAGNPNTKVWVNTNTRVYHCPGTRWYGNTKSGVFMTQKEAQAKGHRPAYGSVCG